jgi:hypothetical protein
MFSFVNSLELVDLAVFSEYPAFIAASDALPDKA